MVNNHNLLPIRARLTKRTKTTKEVLGAVGDKDKVIAMTCLQWVLMSMSSKKKRKTSSKLDASIAIGKGIILISISRTQIKSQKTTISLGNLHASDCN